MRKTRLKGSTHGEHRALECDVLPGDAIRTNGENAVSTIYISVPYGRLSGEGELLTFEQDRFLPSSS